MPKEVPELGRFGTEITGVFGFPESWRERHRKTASVRPKIVCKPCNSGWMSRLQRGARPHVARLVRGEAAHLDTTTQEIVAAWLAMTVISASRANDSYGGWAIPQTHRKQLQETSVVPTGMQVWIAPCTHDDRPAGMVARGVRYRLIRLDHVPVVTPAGLMLPHRAAYAVALSIGNLAALVFGHTYDAIWQPVIRYDGLLGMALKRILPSAQATLDWPRDFAINYGEFDALISVLEPWQQQASGVSAGT